MNRATRSGLIRLASTLPKGSKERRVLLSKLKQPPVDLRKPYYRMGDGLASMEDAAADSKDKDLIRLVSDVDKAVGKVRDYLNKHYNWD